MDKKAIITSVMSALIVALMLGYWNLNMRVKALEIQVETINSNQEKASQDMAILIDKVSDIQIKVTRLGDTKADKKYIE